MNRLASLLLIFLLPAMTMLAAKDKILSDDSIYDQVRPKLANDPDGERRRTRGSGQRRHRHQ